AAMLTHENILSNLNQMVEWMKPGLTDGRETVITALPLYHVFSLTANCFSIAGSLGNIPNRWSISHSRDKRCQTKSR
ncbi:hypothetical protein EBT25_13160, partial [bacterium]|nr:hypothetical protein [bacterium]